MRLGEGGSKQAKPEAFPRGRRPSSLIHDQAIGSDSTKGYERVVANIRHRASAARNIKPDISPDTGNALRIAA
jgi:hypothetical protein